MLRVIALTSLAALAAGCTVNDACANDTVLIALTLEGITTQADELDVVIVIDNGAPHESFVAHTPDLAAGNIVVKFPSGYPLGHTVSYAVVARAAGAELGEAAGSIALGDACEAVRLTIAPGGVDAGSDDLASGDDLSTPPDLTPPADLAQCVPTTENCFNGIDDDCDGHIDCDDPDCPSTVAVCVPAVTAPFVVGTTLNQISLCPGSYTPFTPLINSGLTSAANCSSGCNCTTTCFTSLYHFGNMSNCPNTDNENSFSQVDNTSCHSWSAATWDKTIDVHQLSTPATCTQNGTPTKPPVSWASTVRLCTTTLGGGGCTAGNICAPVTPGPKCEVAAGAHSCDPGYTNMSSWYTDYNDARVCSCSCGAPSGSCGSTVTLYTDSGCNNGAASFTASGANNINCNTGATTYLSGKILAAPTCGLPTYNPPTGSLTGTGLQTLCCAP
jgi:hypothetical protein